MARVIFLVPSPPSHLFFTPTTAYLIRQKRSNCSYHYGGTLRVNVELSVLTSKIVNKNLHFLDSMQVHTYLSSFTAQQRKEKLLMYVFFYCSNTKDHHPCCIREEIIMHIDSGKFIEVLAKRSDQSPTVAKYLGSEKLP